VAGRNFILFFFKVTHSGMRLLKHALSWPIAWCNRSFSSFRIFSRPQEEHFSCEAVVMDRAYF
jgi:hypothetical protein